MGALDTIDAVQLPVVLRDQVGYLLHRAVLVAHALGREDLPGGRHPKEWAVLAGTVAGAGASQRELGEELEINRTILGKVVDRLVADGLLERVRDPRDRRAWIVGATPAGRAALEAAADDLRAVDARYTARLDAGERARLVELLAALLDGNVGPSAGAVRERVPYLVVRAHKRARARFEEGLEPLGLDVRHFGTLSLLAAGEVDSQQALARLSGQAAPVIVGVLDELEAMGLARRTPDPGDRRVRRVAITGEGRDKHAAAAGVLAGVQAEMVERTGAAGDRELAALLRKLLGADAAAGEAR